MRLAALHALGAGALVAATPWLAPWQAIVLLAGWTLALVGTTRPYLRQRLVGVAVALLVLAIVAAAPVVARAL